MDFIYETKDELKNFCVKEDIENGVNRYDISFEFAKETVPSEFTVKFSIPMIDADGIWTPSDSGNTEIVPVWSPKHFETCISENLPVFCVYGSNAENRFTVSLSEIKSNVFISAGVVEENCECACIVRLFTLPSNPIKAYSFTIYTDYRKIPFFTAVKDAKSRWESSCGAKPCKAPEAASYPVYSTWYSFHQNVNASEILDELRTAKKDGFGTVIVDDGWQCDDNNRGYAYAGDWKPSAKKIGNIRDFTDECHKIGIKVMFWYAVPFIGYETENFERFKGKYLYMNNNLRCASLDPRFKDVRDFISGIYVNAIKEYKLDGLKLDFIDHFKLSGDSPKNYEDMDIPVLEDAVYALMYSIYEKLYELNPGIILEFRQKYVGPLICAFGNMLRVSDCPYSGRTNARSSIDLRLTSGSTPVHTDMTMWHKDTTNEDVARQLISGLFAVPQISVKLSEIPDEHHTVIKEFLNYWHENKKLLLSGDFYCSAPQNSYSFAGVKSDSKEIVLLMSESVFPVTKDKTDIFNATANELIYADLNLNAEFCTVSVFDCLGNKISSTTEKNGAVIKIKAPKSSRISIEI